MSSFSSLNDTWSQRSDLLPGNYDPYPELEPNKAWWLNKENYTQDYRNPCNNYKWGGAQNKGNSPYDQSIMMFKEGYTHSVKKNYNSLQQTWGTQQPYTTN